MMLVRLSTYLCILTLSKFVHKIALSGVCGISLLGVWIGFGDLNLSRFHCQLVTKVAYRGGPPHTKKHIQSEVVVWRSYY